MIQILALRSFVDKKTGKAKSYDKLIELPVEIKSVKELFKNWEKVIKMIPEEKRWNIFYTVANCTNEKREFSSSNIIAIDIDGLDHKYFDNYIPIICKTIGIEQSKTGVVDSGNGMHLLVNLDTTIKDSSYYKANRHHFKVICEKVNKALDAAGLPGACDASVFEPRRILRMPGTENRKKGKDPKRCTLVEPIGAMQDFNLSKLSGIPDVPATGAIDPKILKKYPKVDSAAVIEGCSFLQWCKTKPNEIDEPQWYAALSITSRLNDHTDKDGYAWSHEISEGHKLYDYDETESKIERALACSGPRTCDNIHNLWTGCSKCPNYQKVSSPILIRDPDTIPTEHTGFHNIPWDGKGKPSANYVDLQRAFNRDNPYRGLDGSGHVQVWTGTHYRPYERLFLDEFAQTRFDPPAKENMRREFRSLITSTNLKPMSWWQETIRRKINFQNGYLDIDTMEFKIHTEDTPFRYVLPYEYDPQADCPTFKKALAAMTGGDVDTQNILLEYMGYCLSNDDCWTQKALVMVGDGANGKSTFIETLTALAGKGNYASLAIEALGKSEYNRQLLDGKLFNISEETPTKALMDSGLFKSLTTGGEIQVRSPYKEPYFIKNSAKLIFTCNELPVSPDNSYGFYRRVILVPFDQTFTKETEGYDPHLIDKLMKELPGIFNLAIAGYKSLVTRQAFTECQKASEKLDEYQLENDTVLYWAKESLVVYTNGGFSDHFAPMREMFEAYRYDTQQQGRHPVTFQKFTKALSRIRAPIWEGIDYRERYGKKRVKRGEKSLEVRGLHGIDFSSLS